MKVCEIKDAITALPDDEIEPLLKWLRGYYDSEVWDRQIEADLERLGPEAFKAALEQGMEEAGEKHKAALRLLNNLQFRSEADREQCLNDLSLVIGQSLKEDNSHAKNDGDPPFGPIYDGPIADLNEDKSR